MAICLGRGWLGWERGGGQRGGGRRVHSAVSLESCLRFLASRGRELGVVKSIQIVFHGCLRG